MSASSCVVYMYGYHKFMTFVDSEREKHSVVLPRTSLWDDEMNFLPCQDILYENSMLMLFNFQIHIKFISLLKNLSQNLQYLYSTKLIKLKNSIYLRARTYFPHCSAMCVLIALAVCNAPLLYDFTLIYKVSHAVQQKMLESQNHCGSCSSLFH